MPELPGGGWPTSALIEILPQHEGIGEACASSAMRCPVDFQGRFLVWIAPPYAALTRRRYAVPASISPGVILVKTRSPRETLWASEQALRSNACGAVLAWPRPLTYAAAAGVCKSPAEGSPSYLHPLSPATSWRETTPAPLRLSSPPRTASLRCAVLKRRGSPLVNPILLRSHTISRPASAAAPLIMLWIALAFPHLLPLESFPPASTQSEPWGSSTSPACWSAIPRHAGKACERV